MGEEGGVMDEWMDEWMGVKFFFSEFIPIYFFYLEITSFPFLKNAFCHYSPPPPISLFANPHFAQILAGGAGGNKPCSRAKRFWICL